MSNNSYLTLETLEVYKLSRKLSQEAWSIYKKFDWQLKRIIGDQFIRSVDSVGANIAEGYGRFHYLDKIKFYYNARGSHYEAITHWLSLMIEREIINKEQYQRMLKISSELAPKLNGYINSTYKAKIDHQISNY